MKLALMGKRRAELWNVILMKKFPISERARVISQNAQENNQTFPRWRVFTLNISLHILESMQSLAIAKYNIQKKGSNTCKIHPRQMYDVHLRMELA